MRLNAKALLNITILILLFLAILIGTQFSNAQGVQPDSITIEGSIIGDESRLKPTKLNVYIHNQLVVDKVLYGHKFNLKLPVNEKCTLVFSESRFIGKCIVFDPFSHKSVRFVDPYVLDVSMISESYFATGKLSEMDFPVGIIKFNPIIQELEYEELYSDYIWQQYSMALESSQSQFKK